MEKDLSHQIAVDVEILLGGVYFPPMEQFFSVEPLGLGSWVYIVAAGFASYIIIEIEKWIRRAVRKG